MNRMSLLSPRRLARNGLTLRSRCVMRGTLGAVPRHRPDRARAAARLPAGVHAAARLWQHARHRREPGVLSARSHFCRALLAQGYADAMARREELAAFLDARHAKFLPVFRPDGE
jgi:hypothetical protein